MDALRSPLGNLCLPFIWSLTSSVKSMVTIAKNVLNTWNFLREYEFGANVIVFALLKFAVWYWNSFLNKCGYVLYKKKRERGRSSVNFVTPISSWSSPRHLGVLWGAGVAASALRNHCEPPSFLSGALCWAGVQGHPAPGLWIFQRRILSNIFYIWAVCFLYCLIYNIY